MTIVRVGTNQKYAEGWESAFSRKKASAAKPAGKKSAGKSAGKKASPKKSGKKAKR